MPYSKFTLSKAIEGFQLTLVEGNRFLPQIPAVDFPISRSSEQLFIKAPAVILVEAKKRFKACSWPMFGRNGGGSTLQSTEAAVDYNDLRNCHQWYCLAISQARGADGFD